MRFHKGHLIPVQVLLLLVSVLFYDHAVQACSRVLWAENGQAILIGRNMDWLEDMKTNLWVLPRGMRRDGGIGKNSLSWTSRYGSVGAVSYDNATADDLNEKGLNMALLWLAESEYGQRDEKLPGMLLSLWGQYFLDNFATVEEAVSAIEKALPAFFRCRRHERQRSQASPGAGRRHRRFGHHRIFERPFKMYHSRQYTSMTNSPTFDKQLANLKQYKGFGGHQPLPGHDRSGGSVCSRRLLSQTAPQPNNPPAGRGRSDQRHAEHCPTLWRARPGPAKYFGHHLANRLRPDQQGLLL